MVDHKVISVDDDNEQMCQRCRRMGRHQRILYVSFLGVEELKLPLMRFETEGGWGPDLWGLFLCDDCLEDWSGAFAYWWVRAPGHELEQDPFPLLREQSQRPWPGHDSGEK